MLHFWFMAGHCQYGFAAAKSNWPQLTATEQNPVELIHKSEHTTFKMSLLQVRGL